MVESEIGEKGHGWSRVEKFKGDPNKWPDWKENFIAVATVLGCAIVFKKDATRPAGNGADAKAWDKSNEEGWSRLFLSTEGAAKGIVKKHGAAKDGQAAMKALEGKYEQKGEARISALHDQLINTDFHFMDDPEEYFLRLEEIQLRLGELDVTITDATLKGIALSNMPQQYDALRIVLDTMSDVTYDKMKEHARAYYLRNISPNKPEEKPTALLTTSKPFKGTCHNCGVVGHRVSSCREPRKCYRCKKPGHLVKDCQEPDQKQQTNMCITNGVLTF